MHDIAKTENMQTKIWESLVSFLMPRIFKKYTFINKKDCKLIEC